MRKQSTALRGISLLAWWFVDNHPIVEEFNREMQETYETARQNFEKAVMGISQLYQLDGDSNDDFGKILDHVKKIKRLR